MTMLTVAPQSLDTIVGSFRARVAEMQPEDHVLPIDRFGYAFGELPNNPQISAVAKDLAGNMHMPIMEHAVKQLCQRAGVPVQFFHRMPAQMQTLVLNHFIKEYSLQAKGSTDKMMTYRTVRTNGYQSIRAVLTESYTPFDDLTVFEAVADVLGDRECSVSICYANDLTTHVRILFPREEIEVRKGDIVQTGLHISNSEVGARSVRIEGLAHRLVCLNGMTAVSRESSYSIRHVGRPERVRDYVRQAISDADGSARRLIEQFQQSVGVLIEDPKLSLEALVNAENLTRNQFDNLLNAYEAEPMADLFGIVNAVTRAAQSEPDADARYELERVGARLLNNPTPALNPAKYLKISNN